MDYKVVEPSSELFDIDFVKDYLGEERILSADESDLLNVMIAASRQLCEDRTKLSFVKKTYTVQFDHEDMDDKRYTLPFSPIISITSVSSISEDGTTTPLVLNTGYYINGLNEITIYIPNQINTLINDSGTKLSYRVVYTSGYGDDETTELPHPLRIACLKLIQEWWSNRANFYQVLSERVKALIEPFRKDLWL